MTGVVASSRYVSADRSAYSSGTSQGAPGRPGELISNERGNVGRSEHAGEVNDRGADHRCPKPPCMPNRPRGEIPPVGISLDEHAAQIPSPVRNPVVKAAQHVGKVVSPQSPTHAAANSPRYPALPRGSGITTANPAPTNTPAVYSAASDG